MMVVQVLKSFELRRHILIALALYSFTFSLVACKSNRAPVSPVLATDGWKRDSAPIITAGACGDDGLLDISIADPDVLYDMHTGVWYLWYQTGRASEYTASDNQMVIRFAQSTDGGASWVISQEAALVPSSDSLAWDAIQTETPSVVYDSNAPEDRQYKLYYSGASGEHPLGFPNYQIGLAISSDGHTFRRLPRDESPYDQAGLVLRVADALPDTPNLADGVVADPEVQLINGVYHLWFSSLANDIDGKILAFGISHATSSDGIHWIPSPDNPIPSLRNAENSGGQQPSVAWNPALQRWEMWFTLDAEREVEQIPSTFNPALGFWLATSADALSWEIDYDSPRDFYWRPDSLYEEYGLLTGVEVAIVDGIRHLFYAGWGSNNVPEGFIVPVRDRREFVPAVLNLIRATKDAGQ